MRMLVCVNNYDSVREYGEALSEEIIANSAEFATRTEYDLALSNKDCDFMAMIALHYSVSLEIPRIALQPNTNWTDPGYTKID